MTVASVLVGIAVVVIIATSAFVVIRDTRKGNHCASCRGCAMGCRDRAVPATCVTSRTRRRRGESSLSL